MLAIDNKQLNTALRKAWSKPSGGFRRLAISLPGHDLLQVMGSFPNEQATYWSSRDGRLELLAIGHQFQIRPENHTFEKAFAEADERVHALPGLSRLYSTVCFDPLVIPYAPWEEFYAYEIVLPELEFIRTGNQLELVAYIPDGLKKRAAIDSIISRLAPCQEAPAAPTAIWERVDDTPDHEAWTGNVLSLTKLMKASELAKAVLSRQTTFTADTPMDPFELFTRLRERTDKTSNFMLQRDSSTFLGCSPEMLFERNGRTLHTEAIAGTRPLGTNDIEVRQLRHELLNCRKERHEHDLVCLDIVDKLPDICEEYSQERAMEILQLSNLQHLYSTFVGDLEEETTDGDILSCLHPTASICGLPQLLARSMIATREPAGRGLYSGLVGWLSATDASFTVAIRSALIQGMNLYLYAGAGIVRDSDPQREWQELEQKIQQFLEILTA